MLSSFGPAEVFVIGADDGIYAQSLDANGAPVGRYFQITGFSVKSVTPGIPFSYELFAIGTDNQVYFQKVTGSGTSTPQDLTPVSAKRPPAGQKPCLSAIIPAPIANRVKSSSSSARTTKSTSTSLI